MFKRVTIVGVGLIGGSLARAIRRAGGCDELVGCGRDPEHLKKAVELGVIDRYEVDIGTAVQDSEMIVVAVPLGAMEGVLRRMAGHLMPEAVVTDVGSAKGGVVKAARAALGDRFPAFVPGHPVAGTEKSGVEASFPRLFEEAYVILTPLPETSRKAVEQVHALWDYTGARIVEMDVNRHDAILAATSHLPHLLAYSLVDTLAFMNNSDEIFRFAAGGFRDFTRIASSDPVMWRDICLENREALLEVTEIFGHHLDQLSVAIRRGDGESILRLFERAKQARDRICE